MTNWNRLAPCNKPFLEAPTQLPKATAGLPKKTNWRRCHWPGLHQPEGLKLELQLAPCPAPRVDFLGHRSFSKLLPDDQLWTSLLGGKVVSDLEHLAQFHTATASGESSFQP